MSKLNLRAAFSQINLNTSQKKFLRNSAIALVGWFFLADAVPIHNFFTDILTQSSQKTIQSQCFVHTQAGSRTVFHCQRPLV